MINTLAALLVALTLGTVALMVMETDPVRPEVTNLVNLTATTDITATRINPLDIIRTIDDGIAHQPMKWRDIVIHATGAEGESIADKCHFIIDHSGGDTTVRATDLWRRQEHSRHITGPNSGFNDTSIAVCIVGDFSRSAPPGGQFHNLVELSRALQSDFQISSGHVYLQSDLTAGSQSPGAAFPTQRLYNLLLRSSR